MKITVITIVYNDEEGILGTLESVPISNAYFEFEIIVKDGGSSDKTIENIQIFSEKRPITFESEKDSGIYNAMNRAVEMASTDSNYVIFMNSGDMFSDTAISTLKQNTKYFKEAYDVIVFPISSVDDTGTVIPVRDMSDYTKLNRRPYVPHQSTFVKTSLILKFKFNENYKILADYDFFCKLLVLRKMFVNIGGEPLSIFLQGGVSSTYNKQLVFLKEQVFIQRLNFNKVYYTESLIPFLKWLLLRYGIFRLFIGKFRDWVLK
ncbi:MAG: putative colanic acid biosynthesis glycosyltransferase [Francisellaceae bacterium]|jgi:putative colanic acid biosynthesis glycosyltransferase